MFTRVVLAKNNTISFRLVFVFLSCQAKTQITAPRCNYKSYGFKSYVNLDLNPKGYFADAQQNKNHALLALIILDMETHVKPAHALFQAHTHLT